jgi:MSHA pilin protein MshC
LFLQRGFTLTELVVTIVIAGVLAAVAYTRFSVSAFTTDGYKDQVIAAVRYAHKLAVAQRRNVYVAMSGSAVALCYDSGCGMAVSEPPGGSAFTLTPPSSVTLDVGTPFHFDSLGRPRVTAGGAVATSAMTVVITGDAVRTITVEPQTGFVH